MTYNAQRSINKNMNMTGTYNMNMTGTVNHLQGGGHSRQLSHSITSEPPHGIIVSPIKERAQPFPMNSSKGYNQFIDDEVIGAINNAAGTSSTTLSKTDLISTVLYLVWGLTFLISHSYSNKAKCPFLTMWAKNVGIYFLVLAIARGSGLFAQFHESTNDSQKQLIRFAMRIGRPLELFFLLCITVCLSTAASSPCDTDCGKLYTITVVFFVISWVFLLTLSILYSIFIYKQYQKQSNSQTVTA